MTRREQIARELASVESLLEGWDSSAERFSTEWFGQQSMLKRQVSLLHEATLYEDEYEFQIFLQGDTVHESRVDAGFLGEFLKSIQTVVTAIVDGDIGAGGSRGSYATPVVEASELQLVATGAGSFMMGLQGREFAAQGELSDDTPPSTPLEYALDRLMALVEAGAEDVDGESLRRAASELGGHRAIARTLDLSDLISANGTSARMISRNRLSGAVREARLSPGVAHRISVTLHETEVRDTEVEVDGRLHGVRWARQVFDLRPVEESEPEISGTLSEDLRQAVKENFDQIVTAKLMKRTIRLTVDEEESVSYTLVDVRPIDQPSGWSLNFDNN